MGHCGPRKVLALSAWLFLQRISVQLWSDQTTNWTDIESPLNITRWVVKLPSGELLPVDLDEYLVEADREPFTVDKQAYFIPYSRNSAAQEDQLALFPSALQTAIQISLLVLRRKGSIACPVTGVDFDPTASSVLNIGDSFTVSFSSTIVPARVKICGRYHPQPGVNNGNDGQYTFGHTVRSGDVAGACSVLVYLPNTDGILAVFEQATNVTIDLSPKGNVIHIVAVRCSLCECFLHGFR